MTYIELRKLGISGVMIDGYMPDFSELKKIDWDCATEHKLSILSRIPSWKARFEKHRQHLEPGARNQSAIINSAIYGKLIDAVRRSYCPYTDRTNWPCYFRFYPSKGPNAMKYSFAIDLKVSPEEAYDIFNADAQADLAKGKGEYASLITVVDRRPEAGCHVFKDCNTNWIDFLKFESKKRKDHSRFDVFEAAAKEVLIDYLIMKENDYLGSRCLSDYFR